MSPVLYWVRDDLRIRQNPALSAALASGRPVHIAYIYDPDGASGPILGGAQRWWLHESLAALDQEIRAHCNQLHFYVGNPKIVLRAIAERLNAGLVVWNRRYHPAQIAFDTAMKSDIEAMGVPVKSFSASLLNEPWTVTSKTGGPMKVFTPYWRTSREALRISTNLATPSKWVDAPLDAAIDGSVSLDALNLRPSKPDWAHGLAAAWQPGETGAHATLKTFLEGGLRGYADQRNRPDLPSTSRLSAHLRFGEISIGHVWTLAEFMVESGQCKASPEDLRVFQSELGWREFSYHLLFHQPAIETTNIQRNFDSFPWLNSVDHFKAWCRGRTGYPIVDAGMRELWQTGFMHNRVRMIVASFLIKHLMVDWRKGEAWFRDTLVDCDLASNPASWQWVAGSGADAAPYFRIFNPVLQGEKFDPDGHYVRKFVPELKSLSNRFIHAPWLAKPLELASAGIRLGTTYPRPIIDHDFARDRALTAFRSLKERV